MPEAPRERRERPRAPRNDGPKGPWKLSTGFGLGFIFYIVVGLKDRPNRKLGDRFGFVIAILMGQNGRVSSGPSDICVKNTTTPRLKPGLSSLRAARFPSSRMFPAFPG